MELFAPFVTFSSPVALPRSSNSFFHQYLEPSQFYTDFRFLSRSRFILPNRSSGNEFGIHLFTFNPDISSDPGHSGYPSPQLIAIFQLPSRGLSNWTADVMIRMTGLQERGCHNHPDSHRVFEASRNRGILALTISDINSPSPREDVDFFIDPTPFRSFLPIGQSPGVISWASWGPKNSRVFKHTDFSCYGTRVIFGRKLLDFNTLDVNRDISRIKDNGANPYPGNVYCGRDMPTSYVTDHMFAGNVLSELPYREINLEGFRLLSIHPGEDWICARVNVSNRNTLLD